MRTDIPPYHMYKTVASVGMLSASWMYLQCSTYLAIKARMMIPINRMSVTMTTIENYVSTCGPEGLGHAARHGSVGGTEQLHDHAVADALEALDHDPLHEPEAHEHHQPLDEVEADPDEALAVQAEQHDPLPPEPVGEAAEDDSAEHDAAEVDGGDERSDVRLVTHQLPLTQTKEHYSSFVSITENKLGKIGFRAPLIVYGMIFI